MAILLLFYILKLRQQASKTRSHEKLVQLSKEMELIVAELDETIECCEKADLLSESDMQEVFSLMERIYEELYTVDEFKGADKMIKDRILTHAEEAEEKMTLEIIRKMKRENFADDVIAKIVEFPIEKVRAIQV